MTRTPMIGVVLAVYDPDADALEAQMASLAAQRDVTLGVVAVIADRRSGAMVTTLAKDHGLVLELVVPDAPTQSYDSFELGLSAALEVFPRTLHFAFCDQDDVWRPDKLSRSLSLLADRGCALVHTDAEVADADGHLRAPSLHKLERRVIPHLVRDLLVENCVTGMTALFTRDVAEAALPFPRQAALFFHHDLWLALVANVMGGIAWLDEPLVVYRQHENNVVGAGAARGKRHRLFSAGWRRHWGGTYFVAAYLAKSLYLRSEELAARAGPEVDRERLHTLRPYLSECGLGLAHLWDAVRFVLRGRRDLACHSALFTAVRCARAAIAAKDTLFRGFVPALAEFDRRAFATAPGAQPVGGMSGTGTRSAGPPKSAAAFRDRRQSLSIPVRVDHARPDGVSVLVPSLNPAEVFAGIATAIDIGLGLAQRGHRVTFVATDLPIANERATRAFLSARALGLARQVMPDVVSVPSAGEFVVSARETLVATAWWTAHLAEDVRRKAGIGDAGFYYLIQDFEPGFYPWGRDFAGAMASYALAARPIFNSQPLADFFAAQGLCDPATNPLVFHPAINVARYARLTRTETRRRRLALYGRPEVPRNLFPLGIEALERFLAAGEVSPDAIDLVSVGMAHEDVLFAGGHRLRSLGKIPWPDYPKFLSGVDLGLSLMLSPHPSHPPLEMAAAGARVVTNDFAAKTLASLTPAIRSAPVEVGALSEALLEAWNAGSVTMSERRFSLEPLGMPLAGMIDRLSEDIGRRSDVVRLRA